MRGHTKNTDDKTKYLEKEINVLKAKVSKLKAENEFILEALVRVNLF